MSLIEEDDSKVWTDDDLKEAIRRISSGEINFKDAQNEYGISARVLHRQRAIENMRAQLNPEKAKKKLVPSSNTRKDVTDMRKAVEISCTSIGDIFNLLENGTEEVKQLINYECNLIYECKFCRSLFRSLVNFISHKRVHCCDLYSVIHTQNDENEDGSVDIEEKLKAKENFKEFITRPFRVTCRKDLTTILKRITSLSEFLPTQTTLNLESLENSSCAYRQSLVSRSTPAGDYTKPIISSVVEENTTLSDLTKVSAVVPGTSTDKPAHIVKPQSFITEKKFRCPLCPVNCATKRSICRHLKNIHHKTDDHIEKLKSRIQAQLVRKKPSSKSLASSFVALNIRRSSLKNSEKGEWGKDCELCNQHFTNRNRYASHVRICRRNYCKNDNENHIAATFTPVLLPIVSLTPIKTVSDSTAVLNDELLNKNKPANVIASNSKKVILPANDSSAVTRKIGIQVRMNYDKESVNPTSSINGTQNSSSCPIATSALSALDSRQSSSTSCNAMSNSSKPNTGNGQNKNNSKLADFFNIMLEKRVTENENQDRLERKRENASKDGYVLRDCDFRSTCTNELLPHLREQHQTLSKCDLTNINSVFVESSEPRHDVAGCYTGTVDKDKMCAKKYPYINQLVQTSKRKLSATSVKEKQPKQKLTDEQDDFENSVKTKSPNNESKKKKIKLNPTCELVKKAKKPFNSESGNRVLKKVDETPMKKVEKVATREMEKITIKQEPLYSDRSSALHNAVARHSPSEKAVQEDRKPVVGINHHNLQTDPISSNKPTMVQNDYCTEVDLDPSNMSEENYRKSIMTIIFGKEIPRGNTEVILMTDRDQSSASSMCSSSSESEIDERYSQSREDQFSTSSVSSSTDSENDRRRRGQNNFRSAMQPTETPKFSLLSSDQNETYRKICLLSNAKTSSR